MSRRYPLCAPARPRRAKRRARPDLGPPVEHRRGGASASREPSTRLRQQSLRSPTASTGPETRRDSRARDARSSRGAPGTGSTLQRIITASRAAAVTCASWNARSTPLAGNFSSSAGHQCAPPFLRVGRRAGHLTGALGGSRTARAVAELTLREGHRDAPKLHRGSAPSEKIAASRVRWHPACRDKPQWTASHCPRRHASSSRKSATGQPAASDRQRALEHLMSRVLEA
jgi:hypothetical protein